MLTECTMSMWIRTSEMCFSMKQYPGVCDDVAYNVHSDEEVARVDGFLDSKQEVRYQGAALIIKGQLSSEARTPHSLTLGHFQTFALLPLLPTSQQSVCCFSCMVASNTENTRRAEHASISNATRRSRLIDGHCGRLRSLIYSLSTSQLRASH